MVPTLEESRVKIDTIDKELMRLFEERMEIVADVARFKAANNLPIFHADREAQVIAKNTERIVNPALKPYATQMLTDLMTVSKAYQATQIGLREAPLSKGEALQIGFQGVPGAFGEEALITYFGEDYKRKHYQTFEDVFEAIKYGEITYGVLPIENSSTGSITTNYDLLKKYGFYIVGETAIKVQHNLLALEGATLQGIQTIYSHEQGFEQSSDYLKRMPQAQQVPYYNTAMSAKLVSESADKTKAAIGSRLAAKLYGLTVLQEAINNAKANYTRFIIVGKHEESNETSNKMTLLLSVPNAAGQLYNHLQIFSQAGINMTKIESRPVGDGSFSYFFYIDIEGNKNDENIQRILAQISQTAQLFHVLGCYKKAVLE